jgi:hypothetical protein
MDLINAITQFYNSSFFSVVKFIIGIYVLVLFVDIILLLMQRGLGGNIRETVIGIDMPRELASFGGKKKLAKKWNLIRARLNTGRDSQYKIAIIEADNIIDSLIRRMGYGGENMGERLDNVPFGQLDHIEELKQAHEVRNRIVQDDHFALDRKSAEETMDLYEEFLRYFEVL